MAYDPEHGAGYGGPDPGPVNFDAAGAPSKQESTLRAYIDLGLVGPLVVVAWLGNAVADIFRSR